MTFEPILLTDKIKLNEVFQLRVNVWENSPQKIFVNRKLFPNGWTDHLDNSAYNFIIIDSFQNVIAAARLNIFNDYQDFPFYKNVKHLNLPIEFPYGYYSRLVVSNSHQGNGLSSKLDNSILELADTLKLNWLIGLASERTQYMIEKLGFVNLGEAFVRYHPSTPRHLVNVIIKIL